MSPRFSVILPVRNAESSLPATLASLRAQSFTDWEAICVEDGSTDGSAAILREAAATDARIGVVEGHGAGVSAARNLGAAAARGEILAFLDADDLWSPARLGVFSQAFEHEDRPGAVYARVAFFRTDATRPGAVSSPPPGALTLGDAIGENPVCTMSNIAVTAAAFAATGGFDETMAHAEDLEWIVRLVGAGVRIVPVDAVLTWYRTSAGGLSTDLEAMHAGWRRAAATARRLDPALDGPALRKAEAVHLRYLARRALRIDAGRLTALRLALRALAISAPGFFADPRRGLATLAGALAAPCLPPAFRRAVFAER